MRKKIALVSGGDSSEFEISLKSAEHLAQHVDNSLFELYRVVIEGESWTLLLEQEQGEELKLPIDKSDFSALLPSKEGASQERLSFDAALIMIHGTPGENGILQAYFELISLPYTSSPAEVSSITFNKFACKAFLKEMGVEMAKGILLRRGESYNIVEIISSLSLPLFVKPNSGGSSFGATKVKSEEELKGAIERAFLEDEAILIEQFIEGREMTNALFERENGELYPLPTTEIISQNEFFDYQAKYLGASQEITPAEISKELSDKIAALSSKIFRKLGCRGFIRVDYIIQGEKIYFLEVNTVPGMTQMSLVPQQIRAAGLTIKEFLTELLLSTLKKSSHKRER